MSKEFIDDEIYITNFLQIDMLQKIQDSFTEMTGMAAIIADNYGIPVTEASNFSEFCKYHVRKSQLGHQRCENCDKYGAESTMKSGEICPYYCHSEIIEFSAPIILNGKLIGCFTGGQVLTAVPDMEKIEQTAEQVGSELGIDREDYIHAIRKIPIADEQSINKAAKILKTFAEVLSNVAERRYEGHLKNIEVEKSAQLKSDFLANMSHEIRTPMNSILGMAEMALREDMSQRAKDFIHQIRASGKNLLTIINDILDFSKIESGKMDIIEVPYEPLSMINDIANMINSRIGNKNIEFTVDAPPEIPHKLYGDNIRIQQIIINLLTNAVKFTKQGQVQLKLKCRKKDENTTFLKILISDTGCGIKEENLDKIFESFQQVDSKRNRNIEGTGLGLAITQQLLALMGGFIDVESEYNVGSTFAIKLPQKIVSHEPSVPKADKSLTSAVIVQNMYVCTQLVKDLSRLNTSYAIIQKENYVDALDFDFMFVEEDLFSKEMQDFVIQNPKLQCIIIENRKSFKRFNVVNIRTIRKPIYVLSLYSIMGIGEDYAAFADFESDDFPFTAPEAKILIVDDNSINLTVAQGLLEPLNMQIDTATGAKDAINKLRKDTFDLIFMDHMMPEIDGVEATHMIRTTFPDYEKTPIIALTANAVANAKEMFLSEGMNDFVAKPIEIKDIVSKLKKWLPHEKIIITETPKDEEEDIPVNGPFYKEIEVEEDQSFESEPISADDQQSPDSQTAPSFAHQQSPDSQTAPSFAHQPPPASQTATTFAHQPSPASQTATTFAHQPSPASQTATTFAHQPSPASQTATTFAHQPSPASQTATNFAHQPSPASQTAPTSAHQPASQTSPASAHQPSPQPAAPKPAKAPNKGGPLEIEGLNVKLALSLVGNSEKLFMTILKQYYCSIEQKARSIEAHYNNAEWKDYTVEVHALKSTSKQIGAEHVSEMALELEHAGNEGNISLIQEKTAEMLAEYRKYKPILKPYFPDVPDDDEEKAFDKDKISEMLNTMSEAIENFDSLQMDETAEELSKFKYDDAHKQAFETLKNAVSASDLEGCSAAIDSWRQLLG